MQLPRWWTVVLVMLWAVRPAAGQSTIWTFDGALSLGYNSQTNTDQTTDPNDPPSNNINRLFTDVRPSAAVQFGSPRLAWRASYLFAGSFTMAGDESSTYSNAVNLALAAQLGKRSTMIVSAGLTQGGTAFQLSAPAPDAGSPQIRAPGNPSMITATVGEAFVWEAGPHYRVGQGLNASISSPQDDLGRYNAEVSASFSLDRVFPRDAVGLLYRPTMSVLRQLDENDEGAILSVRNALLVRWSHDFNPSWTGAATAGVEQVITLAGSYPLSFVPTGSLNVTYSGTNAVASLAYSHGVATNLQTGTVAQTDQVGVRAAVSFDPLRPRVLGMSAGFIHSDPLGETTEQVAAGTGTAVQGDIGFIWGVTQAVMATARYSVAYQFDQAGGLQPSLAHVFLVGVAARYSNTRRPPPRMPSLGRRVDGTDAVPFEERNIERLERE